MLNNLAIQVNGGLHDVPIDWTDALLDIGAGETIVSSEWELLFGSIELNTHITLVGDLAGHTFNGSSAVAWFKGGQAGTISKIQNNVTTSGGRKLNDVVTIKVMDNLNPRTTVPLARTFTLVPRGTGLVGSTPRILSYGLTTTIAIDFRNDLPRYGRVAEIDLLSVVSGNEDGLVFEASSVDKSLAKIRISTIAVGEYVVRARVFYETPESAVDQSQGDVRLTVAA